jgi:hypothetical protein
MRRPQSQRTETDWHQVMTALSEAAQLRGLKTVRRWYGKVMHEQGHSETDHLLIQSLYWAVGFALNVIIPMRKDHHHYVTTLQGEQLGRELLMQWHAQLQHRYGTFVEPLLSTGSITPTSLPHSLPKAEKIVIENNVATSTHAVTVDMLRRMLGLPHSATFRVRNNVLAAGDALVIEVKTRCP